MGDLELLAGPDVRLPASLPASADSARDAENVPEGLRTVWRCRGVILFAADFVMIVASFLIAYYLRFYHEFLALTHVPIEQVDSYLKGALILASAWVFLIQRDGGYQNGIRGAASPVVRARSVFVAGLKALAALMAVSYMYRALLLSRPVYLMTGVLAFGPMILMRMLLRELDRDLAAHELGLRRVLVAGLDAQTEAFAARLNAARSTLRLAGFVTADGGERPESFAGHPVVGTLDEILSLYEQAPFDMLVLSNRAMTADPHDAVTGRFIRIVNFCEARGVELFTLPNVTSVAVSQNEVGTFSGMPVVKLCDASLHSGYAVVKRVMDFAGAAVLLVIGLPFWLFIALLVRLTSPGPAVFTQTRAGLHGKLFKIYKFRSMRQDAEARLKELVDIEKLAVPGFKLKNDPRVTSLGRLLRRTSLDEIPQLINILKGEMSLVGPRPEMPQLVERYSPWQRRRLKAKPGLTGYQQVMARGVPLAAAIEYDLVYLKHQSLLLDVYIMMKTVLVVVRGSGVTH
jgi:exopolysaccharide biosynthesis polyprenyl glycosylphosphotransferase